VAVRYTPKVVTDGLVLCLDAGNPKSYPGTGTTWTDLTRTGNNGTLNNGPTFNSANGGYILFDGVNDYVKNTTNSTSSFNFGTTNAITAECWQYLVPNGYDFWFSANLVTNGCEYRFGSNSSGNPFWDMGQHNDREYTSYTLPTNTWCHNVYTGGIESGYITTRIYVNGTFITSRNEGITSLVSPFEWFVGTGENASSHLYNGRLSVIRIYNRVLSVTEILQNFNATKSRFGL
jgi:hypothetical protein